eukprot:782876_1
MVCNNGNISNKTCLKLLQQLNFSKRSIQKIERYNILHNYLVPSLASLRCTNMDVICVAPHYMLQRLQNNSNALQVHKQKIVYTKDNLLHWNKLKECAGKRFITNGLKYMCESNHFICSAIHGMIFGFIRLYTQDMLVPNDIHMLFCSYIGNRSAFLQSLFPFHIARCTGATKRVQSWLSIHEEIFLCLSLHCMN